MVVSFPDTLEFYSHFVFALAYYCHFDIVPVFGHYGCHRNNPAVAVPGYFAVYAFIFLCHHHLAILVSLEGSAYSHQSTIAY